MKRTAFVIALLLSLSLLCTCAETPPPATTAPSLPPETTQPTETAAPNFCPAETTVPVETTAPIAQDFSEYETLLSFSADPNWLARAIGCTFERPEEIDLYYLFYLGVEYPGSWGEISPESQQSLVDQGFWREFDLQIMPVEKLEEALQAAFGLSLEDVAIPESWGYIEAEDAYCSNHSDAYFPGVPEITAVADDGREIFIHYTIEGYYNTATDEFLDCAELTLYLERTEDGRVLAVSNLLSP